MEIRDYLRILRHNWVLIVALPLVGLLLGLGYSLIQTPQYSATAAVFVSTQQATSVQDLSQGNTFTQEIVKSYADIVKRPIVLESVISSLKLNLTPAQLADKINATAPTDTVVLEIDVTDPSPTEAARIADALSSRLSAVVEQLSPSTAGESSPVKVSPVQTAAVPTVPVSPRIPLNVALGFAAGLMLGLAYAVLRERLDTRVRGERDVALVTDHAILGGVAFDAGAAERPLIVHVDPRSPRAESFRALRTNLQFLDFEAASRVMVITSSVESEGKSTSAANLAIALADAGSKILIVDGDLRRPKLAEYLGIESTVGLTDVLIGKTDLDEAIQPWGDGKLAVLPSGHVPPNPSELLQSAAMVDLLEELKGRFETIIFDAPPLLPVTDAAILAKRTAGAIVVCAMGRTNRHQLAGAISALDQVDAKILGLVLTMVPSRGPDAYGYGRYGYGYGYAHGRGYSGKPDALPGVG